MRLLELWTLFEGKEQYVINNFGDRLVQAYEADPTTAKEDIDAPRIVDILAGFDPTKNNKYLVWIAKLYADRQLKSEDLFKLPEELEAFARVQNKLEIKDIMRYPNLPALSRAVMEFDQEDEPVSNKQQAKDYRQKLIDDGSAEVVFQTPTLKIVSPKTKEASCEFGKGTKWCTAATKGHNYFDDYGTLFIIYPKNAVEGSPFQFEIQTKLEYDVDVEDGEDEESLRIGYIADVVDDHMGLEDLLNRVPDVRTFLKAKLKAGELNIEEPEEYEAIYNKPFEKMNKGIRQKHYMKRFWHRLRDNDSKAKREFISEFNKLYTAAQRQTIFNKNRKNIILNAFRGSSAGEGIKAITAFFGKKNAMSVTEKDLIDNGALINTSSYGSDKVAARINKYSKALPKFNASNMMNAVAKSFAGMSLPKDKWGMGNAMQFIKEMMASKKNRAGMIKAYSSKKHQMIFGEILTHPHFISAAQNRWGDKDMAVDFIGEYLLTDPITIEFVKDELQLMFSKVKAKAKAVKGEENPTQKAIRDIYTLVGNPGDLRRVEPYEMSMQDRAEVVTNRSLYKQDDIENLSLDWYYEESGESVFNTINATGDDVVPGNKLPNDKLKTTFITAGKNSYLLVFMARGKSWILQIPYSGKITNSGNPKVAGNKSKLYDAESVDLGNLSEDVARIIEFIKNEPDDARDIDVDADHFAESRKYK